MKKKMPLTKLDALKKSLEMWEWLAQQPYKSKAQYFYYNNITDIPLCECYMCEWCDITPKSDQHCELCPIDWLGNGDFTRNFRCERYPSPYRRWEDYIKELGDFEAHHDPKFKEVSAVADEIVDLIKEAIEREENA